MAAHKVVILDGSGASDEDLTPILRLLEDVHRADGAEVETFPLRKMKLAHCLGCFGCWLKTPGMCVEDDTGRQVAKAAIQSDTLVLYTPVTFGGYSPDLKKMLDHFIQLTSPFFEMDHGEVHHPPRYARRPRLIVVGVQTKPDAHEAHVFKTLAGRNAINLHPPAFAAEVVVSTDSSEFNRQRFERLLVRSDALPFGDAAASLMPLPAVPAVGGGPNTARRALLIVGSPKTNAPSTSSILGSYLLERVSERGWDVESLTLRAVLRCTEGENALLAAVDRAGLIVFAFPLYVDCLPYLATKALTVIAAHRSATANPPPQRLMAIVNSGFPETHQNSIALAICHEFAEQSGITWAGGLALGGGGAVGQQPLTAEKRTGLPVKHVIRALDLAAEALSDGRPVPAEAVVSMAKNPVPLIPFALWCRMYMRFGGTGFEREAARNGISKERLLDRPYAA